MTTLPSGTGGVAVLPKWAYFGERAPVYAGAFFMPSSRQLLWHGVGLLIEGVGIGRWGSCRWWLLLVGEVGSPLPQNVCSVASLGSRFDKVRPADAFSQLLLHIGG